MAAASLAVLALLGFLPLEEGPVEAPPAESTLLANAVEAPTPPPPTEEELRESLRYLSAASRDRDIEPEHLVRPLCRLCRQLERDEALSRNDRERMLAAVRNRLIDTGDRIFARLKREYRQEKRQSAGDEAKFPSAEDSLSGELPGAHGAGREKEGEALIELIRTTIAPESWDVVGGPGSIYYYKPLKVMVIRQTSEVHWLIGGLRRALEK